MDGQVLKQQHLEISILLDISIYHSTARELVRHNHFKSCTVINEGMVVIEKLKKNKLCL